MSLWTDDDHEHLISLSEGGKSGIRNLEDLVASEKAKLEYYLFEAMKWSHMTSAIITMMTLTLKHKGYHNLG